MHVSGCVLIEVLCPVELIVVVIVILYYGKIHAEMKTGKRMS